MCVDPLPHINHIMSSHVLASVHAVLLIILRVGRLRNGTGPELRHIRLPSLDFSPGLPGRPRRPRTPSTAVEVAQRSISSVSGAPAGFPACRCRWVAWISRVMQQRRSAQTGAARLQHARMCGGHDRICWRACRSPSGPSRSSCTDNRSRARRASQGTCSLRRNTHSISKARMGHSERDVTPLPLRLP